MLNKLLISILTVIVCLYCQEVIPFVLGLTVYLFLSIRNQININVYNKNEHNQSLKKDINSLNGNQAVITSDVRKLIKKIYGKTKEERR